MSAGRMRSCPGSSERFSSTPVKTTGGNTRTPGALARDLGQDLGQGVLSDDEDTFSLLSPIYHDSFDSDEEELASSPVQQMSPSLESRGSESPVRCELPKTPSDQMCGAAAQPAGSASLSAWEMWLLNKARVDRLKLGKKAEEERLLKEQKQQQERQQMQKKIVMEERIHEWIKMKNEKERHEQLAKQRKEEEELQRGRDKKREIEQKAQQKYKDWLQKKNQEKIEREKKEQEKTALREEQERERRRRAQKKFKEWLANANDKSRPSPKSPFYPTSPYDKSYPAPSFYNPIPWKPIHVPPPESLQNKMSCEKPQKQRKSQQSTCSAFRLRNTGHAAHLLQRR
ncbi:coiled-coil domain-containing protein 34 [Cololabis saira]|uniref:coiled-coil domain-containing protein 34 n=1 Tax=Cololabis saira TaxID=129043 RepID=UPI002AD4A24A|nr:coiled-coil domain-containing protein 34 [Cololabis saira]